MATLFLILVTNSALGATMNKCVDGAGNVTFTQQACAGGGSGERISVQSASQGMVIASPSQIQQPEHETRPSAGSARVDVVGETVSPCGAVSSQEIRKAVVQKKIFAGMTSKDAVSSWGKPNKINASSAGPDQWVYYRSDSDAQYLYVDRLGCVTAWN
jgi:hypothetical protein